MIFFLFFLKLAKNRFLKKSFLKNGSFFVHQNPPPPKKKKKINKYRNDDVTLVIKLGTKQVNAKYILSV